MSNILFKLFRLLLCFVGAFVALLLCGYTYLVEKGYRLLLAYAGMPDCIAKTCSGKTTAAKNKTRYKGKMWNSMPPKDFSVWEEICYEYTKHNVEKFGIDVVSEWYLHCFNEPDIQSFFLANIEGDKIEERVPAYCAMYEGFANAVLRVDRRLRVGGPALASRIKFLRGFLEFVKKKDLRLDYIALHNYGTDPFQLNDGRAKIDVEHNIKHHLEYLDVIKECGFSDCEIVVDEWGMCTRGFWNVEECPHLMVREHEVFSAYYAKLIKRFIEVDPNVSKLVICLSGQHEMVEDFSGFRNFFTLNHFAKPIYNAHIMASRLKNLLIGYECENQNVSVVPTKDSNGSYSVMLAYSSQNFEENIPEYEESVEFEENLAGKKLIVYCIDKETTNPYRLAVKIDALKDPTDEQKRMLREEGKMKPVLDTEYDGKPIKIKLAPNSTYLIQIIANDN